MLSQNIKQYYYEWWLTGSDRRTGQNIWEVHFFHVSINYKNMLAAVNRSPQIAGLHNPCASLTWRGTAISPCDSQTVTDRPIIHIWTTPQDPMGSQTKFSDGQFWKVFCFYRYFAAIDWGVNADPMPGIVKLAMDVFRYFPFSPSKSTENSKPILFTYEPLRIRYLYW